MVHWIWLSTFDLGATHGVFWTLWLLMSFKFFMNAWHFEKKCNELERRITELKSPSTGSKDSLTFTRLNGLRVFLLCRSNARCPISTRIAMARTAAMATAKCASIHWDLAAISIYACHASLTQTCGAFSAPRRLAGLRTARQLVGSLLKWPSIKHGKPFDAEAAVRQGIINYHQNGDGGDNECSRGSCGGKTVFDELVTRKSRSAALFALHVAQAKPR